MSSGISAFGTALTWNSQALAELLSIGGPAQKVDTIDLTNHDSANTFREFVAGLRDGGEITVEGNFISGDTNGQIALVTDMQAGTAREIVITGPSAAAFTWTFNAICTSFELSYPHDDRLSFTATFKVTGKPTLAVTASADITTMTGIEENVGGALDFVPNFAGATYSYNVLVNTASTWIKLTVTDATATSITATAAGVEHVLTTGVQSEAIAIGAANSMTPVTVVVKDSGKVSKTYTIYVARP